MIIDIYMTIGTIGQFKEYEKQLIEVPGYAYTIHRSKFYSHEFYYPKQNILVRMLVLPPLTWFDSSANCPDYYYAINSIAEATLQFILDGEPYVCLESFNDILKILYGEKE